MDEIKDEIKIEKYIAPKFTKEDIIRIVERELPDFARGCQVKEADVMLQTQQAWAGDFMFGEMLLIGFAVKYAGFHNKVMTIIPHEVEDDKQ